MDLTICRARSLENVVQYQLLLYTATANRKVPRTTAQFPTCREGLENAAELRCAPQAMRQYSCAAVDAIHSLSVVERPTHEPVWNSISENEALKTSEGRVGSTSSSAPSSETPSSPPYGR